MGCLFSGIKKLNSHKPFDAHPASKRDQFSKFWCRRWLAITSSVLFLASGLEFGSGVYLASRLQFRTASHQKEMAYLNQAMQTVATLVPALEALIREKDPSFCETKVSAKFLESIERNGASFRVEIKDLRRSAISDTLNLFYFFAVKWSDASEYTVIGGTYESKCFPFGSKISISRFALTNANTSLGVITHEFLHQLFSGLRIENSSCLSELLDMTDQRKTLEEGFIHYLEAEICRRLGLQSHGGIGNQGVYERNVGLLIDGGLVTVGDFIRVFVTREGLKELKEKIDGGHGQGHFDEIFPANFFRT